MTDHESRSDPSRANDAGATGGHGEPPAVGTGPDDQQQPIPGDGTPANPWGQPATGPDSGSAHQEVSYPAGWGAPGGQQPFGWDGSTAAPGPDTGWGNSQYPTGWDGSAPEGWGQQQGWPLAQPHTGWGQQTGPHGPGGPTGWGQNSTAMWGGPYPGSPYPPPPNRRRTWIVALSVVLVLAVAGAVIGIVLATGNSSDHNAGGTPPGVNATATAGTGTPTADHPSPKSGLTAATVFPSATLNGTGSERVSLSRVTTYQSADCSKLASGAELSAIRSAGCSQVIAGTYRTTDGTVFVCVMVFELSSMDAAKTIAVYDDNFLSGTTIPVLLPSGPGVVNNGESGKQVAGTRHLVVDAEWMANGSSSYSPSATDAGDILIQDAEQHLPVSTAPSPTIVGVQPAPAFTSSYVFYGTRIPGNENVFDMVRRQTADSADCRSRLNPTGPVVAMVAAAGCKGVVSALYQTSDGRLYSSVSLFAVSSSDAAKNLDANAIDNITDEDLSKVNPLIPPGSQPPVTVDIHTDYFGAYYLVAVSWWADGTDATKHFGPLIDLGYALGDAVQETASELPGGGY